MNSGISVLDWGVIDYETARKKQLEINKLVYNGVEDRLILCEHPPVYTFGKSANKNNLLIGEESLSEAGAKVFETERGGDITFHGPGQLVGYPIINLNKRGIGPRTYVERLEGSMIDLLSDYGVQGYRIPSLTGIWVKSESGLERKIGAIGIKIMHGVTLHGYALNIETDLSYFNHINPCGILDKGVTSLALELGKEVPLDDVKRRYVRHFLRIFRYKKVEVLSI